MIRHVALFEFRAGTADAEIEAMRRALLGLVEVVSSLRGVSAEPDLGLRDGNHGFVLIADFDDPDGFEAYRNDPAHLEVVERYVTPIVVGRAAVQCAAQGR